MKIRKVFPLFFGVLGVFLLLLISGCSQRKEESEVKENTGVSDTEHIVVTYQTMDDSDLTDMDEVTAAINEITTKEIGVEVEFKFIDARDAFSEYSLWISNGKHIDLMIMNNQDITSYIDKNMILPLDDYLKKDAPDILRIMEEEGYRLTEGSVVDGKTYGVTVVSDTMGSGGGVWIPVRYLEEVGIEYEKNHIYTMDEIENLCALLKEKYPDKYPLGQITSQNVYTTLEYFEEPKDVLGNNESMGFLDEKTGKICNFYASEDYYEFLRYLRNWYLKGYIYPDAAITDADISELNESGIVLSRVFSSVPGIVTEKDFGEEIVCLHTSQITLGAQNTKSGFWTIPATSTHPDAAMKFFNLLYHDTRISNLLTWGIENKHYVVTDEENGLIAYPEGKTFATVGYYNPLHLYGDFRKICSMQTAEVKQANQEFSEEGMSHPTGVRGFLYSTEKMAGKIDDVQKVAEKYVPVLESGSVDLDIYYPQFLKELEYAGIEEVLADRQNQYDTWLLQR